MHTIQPKQKHPLHRRSSTTTKPERAHSMNRAEAAGFSASHAGFGHIFATISILPPSVGILQRKLKVNAPGDGYEQDADHVAEQVMRMPEPGVAAGSVGSEDAHAQVKAAGPAGVGGTEAPPAVHSVLRSPGQPLDAATRAFMEPRFGHDFSKVRVHADERAAESANAVQARAYTVGSDVVFGAGEFSPATQAGKGLLSHELTHVVQQGMAHPGTSLRPLLQRQPKPPKSAPPAGGNILYIGMSANSPLELGALRSQYRGKPVAVTAVTLSSEESKTRTAATGATKFDLTSDAGINDFVSALSLTDKQAKAVGEILNQVPNVDRDDWAHVIAVYAMTEKDGKDRMSRVILSGHSRGFSVYSRDHRGHLDFSILATLAGIFPQAAGQTKHLMVPACFAGDEEILLQYYQKAFPNLKTFAGWTFFSPTGGEGARLITGWARTTDPDPATLPAPKTGEATWEAGTYHGAHPQESPTVAIESLRLAEKTSFEGYFTGDKVGAKYTGDLPDYYAQANSLANRTLTIKGADHDYAKQQADRAFRIRFWKEQAAGFWAKHGPVIRKAYGTAKVPNYGSLSRKAALESVAAFSSVANGAQADQAEAQRLLNGLRDLDPSIMEEKWQ